MMDFWGQTTTGQKCANDWARLAVSCCCKLKKKHTFLIFLKFLCINNRNKIIKSLKNDECPFLVFHDTINLLCTASPQRSKAFLCIPAHKNRLFLNSHLMKALMLWWKPQFWCCLHQHIYFKTGSHTLFTYF